VTISQWQWEKSERSDSVLEALHEVYEQRDKQLFGLAKTTTIARGSSTLASHPPLGWASPIEMNSPRSVRGEAMWT
jgi:hypothetical protein